MAINKVMRAALRALSYPKEMDPYKSLRMERVFAYVKNLPVKKPFYENWDETVYNGEYEIPVRIFYPDNIENPSSVILFFHGGGWVAGNIDSYTNVCINISQITESIVISVDYRLAPEYPFPAAPEDCYAVAKKAFADGKCFGIPSENITIMGDSAGGNLAAVVSLMARDRGDFKVERQILIYPATNNNHSESSPFPSVHENGTDYLLTSKRICEYMDFYASCEEDKKNPYFAPILESNLKDQPKTLIITAEFDPLRDEGEEYGRRLFNAGNEVEIYRLSDALHGFFSLPVKFHHVKESYRLINDFLGRHDLNGQK